MPHDGHRRLTNSIDGWFHTSRKCDSGTGHGLADGGVSCGWRSTAENDRVPRNRLIGHQHLRMHERVVVVHDLRCSDRRGSYTLGNERGTLGV